MNMCWGMISKSLTEIVIIKLLMTTEGGILLWETL